MTVLELAPLQAVSDSGVRRRPRGYWAHAYEPVYWRLGTGRLHSVERAWDKEQTRMAFESALRERA